MRFGLCLPQQYLPSADFASEVRDAVEFARLGNRLGYDALMAGDHRLSEPYITCAPNPLMGRIAAESGDMKLLVMSLLSIHNPVDVAEELATLDAVCGGNAILGVALGYRDIEYQAMGVEIRHRVPRMVEGLEVLRQMWTRDTVEFQGRFFSIPETQVCTRPVQPSGPPIWLAANNEMAVRRAAGLGLPWFLNPHADLATLRHQRSLYLEEARASHGNEPEAVPIMREVVVAPSREEAWDLVRQVLAEKYKSYVDWGQDKAISASETFSRPIEELAKDRFVVGTPADCVREIEALRSQVGVDWFFVRCHWPGLPAATSMKMARLFASDVMPALRETDAA